MSFEIETRDLSTELVIDGYTKKIDCKNYWDSHGRKINAAPTQYTFNTLKKFELYRVQREYLFKYSSAQTFEFLFLYVDGKLLNVGEITSFRELETGIKLDCCIGAG